MSLHCSPVYVKTLTCHVYANSTVWSSVWCKFLTCWPCLLGYHTDVRFFCCCCIFFFLSFCNDFIQLLPQSFSLTGDLCVCVDCKVRSSVTRWYTHHIAHLFKVIWYFMSFGSLNSTKKENLKIFLRTFCFRSPSIQCTVFTTFVWSMPIF